MWFLEMIRAGFRRNKLTQVSPKLYDMIASKTTIATYRPVAVPAIEIAWLITV